MDGKIERVSRIKNFIPKRMFFDACFESRDRNRILAEINIDGPLLTREQEYHLFRKYNYIKYRIMKLTVGFGEPEESPAPTPSPPVKLERIGERAVIELERLISQMIEIRNLIFNANIRLVFKPVGRHAPKDSFERDEFVSNAHVHTMKAIDYFDHRRGFKFSTYCVHVIKMNLMRDKDNLRKAQDQLEFHDLLDSNPCGKSSFNSLNLEYNSKMVERIFETIRLIMKKPDEKVEILKRYYGIGTKPMLLRELGEKMNLSRERIRQIKKEAMDAVRHLSYDPL
jgi:RNA polymerase sigma factor (sigma-70 family)